MKCSLGISNFLEEISSLFHSMVFLYFLALITEEGFLHNTKGHCHPRASSAKTRGFHTQLDEGPETP